MMSFTMSRFGTQHDDMFRTFETQHPAIGTSIFPRDWIQPQDFKDPVVGGNTTFSSRWAEVAYFLANTGDRTTPTGYNPQGLPLFALCRRVRLLVPLVGGSNDGVALSASPAYPNDNPDIATAPLNSHASLVRCGYPSGGAQPAIVLPTNRYGVTNNAAGLPGFADPLDGRLRPPMIMEEYPALVNRWGDDVLLSDVLSFEIKAVWVNSSSGGAATGPSQGGTLAGGQYVWNLPLIGAYPNTDAPFDYLPTPQWSSAATPSNPGLAGYRVFDTWSSNAPYTTWNTIGSTATIPLKIRIMALQIRIRVWDRKSGQTRQITIVQDV
jgi:hypothetical protein